MKLVTGREDVFQPTAMVANLDAGDYVAGLTFWFIEPGILFVPTTVGFRWEPGTGMDVFEVSPEAYFSRIRHIPTEISDNGWVVGWWLYRPSAVTVPFRWTPETGIRTLPVPGPGWVGRGEAVSKDGLIIGGNVTLGALGGNPFQAARWVGESLEVVGPEGMWSNVHDVSANGSVLVGGLGPDQFSAMATRWVDGADAGLDPVSGATFSTARHVSDDGTAAIGWATVGGRNVLVRWDASGATVFTPPGAYSIETVNAIDPSATVACGALDENDNWDPFVWDLSTGGFAVIGELGREEDYDRSQALDLSDDGLSVVGTFNAKVVFNGDPPQTGFLWTLQTGEQSIDDILINGGLAPMRIYEATAITGDGTRFVASGDTSVIGATDKDTDAVIVYSAQLNSPTFLLG